MPRRVNRTATTVEPRRRLAWAGLTLAMMMAITAAGTAYGQNNPENQPEFCQKLWKEIGLPRATAAAKITIVCHLGYVVGHDDRTKTPAWVIERLDHSVTGAPGEDKASREGQDFSADPKLPVEVRAKPDDYDHSGFDKGHNAPAADFGGNQAFLDDTFFLSNAVPQTGPGFNRSIWRSLETQVRNLIGANHPTLYVITGAIQQDTKPIKVVNDACPTTLELPTVQPKAICPDVNSDPNAKCTAGVAVPAAMYKIVYDPVMQNAFAILMANKNHTGAYKSGKGVDYIVTHRVSVATIEDLTGLSFFSALPLRKQNQIRSNCVDVRAH